jgi:hypothetical protein
MASPATGAVVNAQSRFLSLSRGWGNVRGFGARAAGAEIDAYSAGDLNSPPWISTGKRERLAVIPNIQTFASTAKVCSKSQ